MLTESDGVSGGPFQAGVSPDGDSALVTNVLDNGGARLLTGMSAGNPSEFKLDMLPFQFFGPPFPMGPTGPEVLAAHGQPIFTADGDTAVVVNWSAPTVPGTLPPSLSVLTGFHTGNIRVAANLVDPALNPVDQRQQIATMPAGLQDHINLYLPPGDARSSLVSLLNDAIAKANGGVPDSAMVDPLMRFIRAAHALGRSKTLSKGQTATLVTLATVGIQAVIGRTDNTNGASFASGPVAPDSIASLFGAGLAESQATAASRPLPTTIVGATVTIIDSTGVERLAPLFMVSPAQINYLVPPGTAAGKATAVVAVGERVTGIATIDIDPISPGFFYAPGGYPASLLQRFTANSSETVVFAGGGIDFGPPQDALYLILFGTGLRGLSGPRGVTAHWQSSEASGDATVSFAGAQGGFDGLDQVNLLLPRSLAGLGGVTITLTFDGVDAPVFIVIR